MKNEGQFYIQKNLGPSGPPDLNKRFVYAMRNHNHIIAQFSAVDPMVGWTDKEEKAMNVYFNAITGKSNA